MTQPPAIRCACGRNIPVEKVDRDYVYKCACAPCYNELQERKNDVVKELYEWLRKIDYPAFSEGAGI